MKTLKWYLFAIKCILVCVSSGAWATALHFGNPPQTGSISGSLQINTYTFSTTVAQVLDFTMVTTSGNLVPKLQLYNSAGTLIASNYSGAPFGCGGSTLEMNEVQVSVDSFILDVSDCSGTNTGNYELYAQSTNHPVGAEPLPFADVQTGAISSPTQSNTYTFSANASDVVDFTIVTTTGSLVPKIMLFNPDGTLNSSNYSGAPFGCGGTILEMNTVTLPVAGDYTVFIRDCADTNSGGYEIYMQRTDHAPGTSLLFGQVQTGSITSETQSNTYTFGANASDVLDFTMLTTSGSLVPKILLYNPNGSLNSSNYSGAPFGCGGSTLEMNTVTLPVTGTYTVLVRDCPDTNTGNYAIYSQRTNNPAGRVILPFAQRQTGLIGSVVRSNTYVFSGRKNEVVDFTLVATNGSLVPKILLYNPNGSLNSSNYSGAPFGCGGSTLEMNTVTLPVTGTYTVLVRDCSDKNTGNYTIYAQSTNNPFAPAPVLWGQLQTGTVGSVAQSNTYSFSGTANNVVDFTMMTTKGSLVPKILLYNPDGSLNSSNYAGAPFGCGGSTVSLNSVTLAQDGDYTMLVRDCSDTNTGNYEISSQCFGICPDLNPISLSFSSQLLGTSSAAKTVTLTNAGTATLTISGISVTGTNSGDFIQTHTCGSTLGPGASCKISVSFHPSAIGARSAAVSVSDDAGGSPQRVTLSGIGTAAKLVPTSLSFGDQTIGTTSAAKTVTMTNVGTTTLTINGISVTGTNAGDFTQTHSCGGTLGTKASCTISVTFHPSASGARRAAVSISDNGGGSPQLVPLSGTGTW